MRKTPQKLEEKVTGLLRNTDYSLSEISRKCRLNTTTIKNIQNKAIEEDILDEKYRRLAGGTMKYQKDEMIEMLKNTDYSLTKIGKEVGLSYQAVGNIQNKAIKEDLLDEKYRRLAGGIVKYQKDEVIKLLKKTDYSLTGIEEKVGLSDVPIKHIQDEAIKGGILDEKYRRLANGVIKHQKDEAIELLRTTDYNLREIGKKVRLSDGGMRSIQNVAIEQEVLDDKYRRLKRGIVKYQRDEVIEMLRTTDDSLRKIGKKVGFNEGVIMNIQEKSIRKGFLDEKCKRLRGGVVKYKQDEAIKLLKTTNYSLSKIGEEVGLTRSAITNIQNKAIKKSILDEKYKRLNKMVKYQQDKIIELLEKTDYSLSKIGREAGLSDGGVSNIQDRAIQKGLLDEKYGRSCYQNNNNLEAVLRDYRKKEAAN